VLLEDQARSGSVTLTIVRQSTSTVKPDGVDAVDAAPEGSQNQNREVTLLIRGESRLTKMSSFSNKWLAICTGVFGGMTRCPREI